jgi:hypothetical protein
MRHDTLARMHAGIADRLSRLPRPPAGMNTPDMRLAIRAGLLAADNRLGARARQVQFASDRRAIELGWRDAWRNERRAKEGQWVSDAARSMLGAAAASDPDTARQLQNIASVVKGLPGNSAGIEQALSGVPKALPSGAGKILAGVTPANATKAVQALTGLGMNVHDAAMAVTRQLQKTPGAVAAAQKALPGRQTIQAAGQALAVELAKPTSAAGRRSLAGRDLALPDGSFPVPNANYWDKARQAIGRVADPAKRAAVARLLRRTAPRFGKTAALKNSWAAPGGSKHSNTGQAMEFAMPTTRPIRTPSDLVIVRGEGGVAIIRHRLGGDEIGRISRAGRGWQAAIGGKPLTERNHQRTALADLIGTHNRGAATPEHRPAPSAGSALQPPAQQTPLMAQYGIPAIRALATPSSGSDDGPRVTSNGAGSDDNSNGLNAKGQGVYKKLKAKGWPDARAMAFAKRAQNMGSS